MRFHLQFIQLFLLLAQLAFAKEARKHVDLVMSIDQYYDTVNRNDSYTMVEYTTSWCHHCKRLRPNFVELMQLYAEDTTKPSVVFLEVNCEIFGSTICSGFPGFPIIHLIQPRSKPLDLPAPETSPSLWKKIKNYLVVKYKDPRWQLDPERIIEYTGARDPESMKSFIEAVRAKDKLLGMVEKVLDSDYNCNAEEEGESQKVCEIGKEYLKKTISSATDKQLAKERLRLENILQKNAEVKQTSEAYHVIKFKLQLLNRMLIDHEAHDEL